ncbi:MAG: TonB-dependent receptor [Bacteroidetes bacterium]|nr:TonB-dependent receptor [Bacteroidota bacterium]MBL6944039.1 TonB-dependent receptor [Bacteroidales bacterium]
MSKICLKYQLIILFILGLASNVQSQYIYDTLQLSELEVISYHNDLNSTSKVTTLNSIARKELSLNDIGELLSAYTPVFVKSYGRGSLSTVSFRGTGASHTKVVWEGFNINSPMLGQTDFSQLPGSFFDEVELLYGGGSLIAVSGALGGSINLKSCKSLNDNLLSIRQSVGSFNTYNTSAELNFTISGVSSGTRIIRQSSLNNFPYFNNAILPSGREMIQSNANFITKGFTQQFSYRISDKQEITFISWNQWNDRNIPTIMTNIEKGGSQEESQKDFFSRNILKWVLQKPKTKWEVKGAYFVEELNYFLQTSDTLKNIISLIDSRNRVENYSFAWNVSNELKKNLILKAGMELRQQQVVSNNYTDSKHRRIINSYVSLKTSFKNMLTAEALIRSEISDAEFVPLMPMLGINYKPFTDRDFHFRVNVSRNFNLPSLNDVYWYPGGNEDLLPEQSFEAETGLDYKIKLTGKHIITLSGSAYTSSVKNWIIWLPGDYRYWSPENIASVHARGIELSLHINGNFRKIRYNVFGEYAYTRTTNNSKSAKISGLSDIQLLYVPEHSANGYLNISKMDYYANWSLMFTGSRNTSLNNDKEYSFTLPHYIINNFSMGKKFKLKKTLFDLRFKIYNLFNVDYQAVLWRAMPGRNYEISLSCSILR